MTEEQHLMLWVSTVPSLLLAIVYFCVMRPATRLCRFRDDLFSMRDELFDEMVEKDLPLDDPACRACRRRINSLIWFSDLANPLTVGWMIMAKLRSNEKSPDPWTLTEDPTIKEMVRNLQMRILTRVVSYFFVEHFTGWALATVLVVRSAIKKRLLWWRALENNGVIQRLDGISEATDRYPRGIVT